MSREQIRASDLERDVIVRRLRDQCATGRLSIDDLDERLEHAYAAVTRAELNGLVSDLPSDEPHAAPPAGRRRFFWPGITPFSEQRHLGASSADSFAAAQREMVPRMGTQGFHVDEEIWPRRLRFVSDGGLFITVMFHPAIPRTRLGPGPWRNPRHPGAAPAGRATCEDPES